MAAWAAWAKLHAPGAPSGYFHDSFGLRNDAIIGGLLPGIRPTQLQRLADAKEEEFRLIARANVEALPGVVQLLDWLDANDVPRAIVTSTPRANLDLILTSLGIESRFQALVAEEDASKGKPDPEGFLVAARRVGVTPAQCVVIEDAPHGLAAARAAGMTAIGVTTTHPATELGLADLVVSSLAEAEVRLFIQRAADRAKTSGG
jgi:HAD superfamily hydrolase (TIGR01509 family)